MTKLEKDCASVCEHLDDFLSTRQRNSWLYLPQIEIYIRKGRHCINGAATSTLDIASITVIQHRGEGFGMMVINAFHDRHPFVATYIESILNDKFYTKLKDVGWLDADNSPSQNVYKFKE